MTEETSQGEESNLEAEKEAAPVSRKRKCILHSALMPFLFWIVFAALFYFAAYELPGIKMDDIENAEILHIFQKYSLHAGVLFGFLSMVGGYIAYLFLRIFKLTQISFVYPVLSALLAMPWYLVARNYVYLENRYTDLTKAIIFYIAEPLLWVAQAMFVISIIWLIVLSLKYAVRKGFSQKAGVLAMFLILPFFLTGCTTINEWACQFFDDPDHCFQNLAVQDANPDDCAKIKGEDFQSSGSNPPRDKCYKRIAENTGDLSVCDNIEGGPYSYTKEECILNTSIEHKNPSGCNMLTGADREECVSQVGPSITSGGVMEIDDQIALLEKELENTPDEGLEKQLNGLREKREDYLSVMNDDNKKEYESLTDPRNRQAAMDYYSGKIDRETKDTLVELNNRLREQGNSMSEKEYDALRDVLAYKNDPENDIENMDPKEMLKLRWNEKLGNAVDYLKFWNSNPTEKEKKYDESLFIYQRMLERQAAVEKGLSQKQQDMDRELGRVGGYIKDQVYGQLVDEAKKQAFGELMDLVDSSASGPTTAVLGEAIDTVKKEAKSAEFRGLVRAYNMGMEEELAKAGGDIEKAHARVTQNLQDDPYRYEDKHTFAHYQNILQNKDCDGSNPHCIKRDVFWKAMKKSYQYQNQR
jgi:hypothetical protein